MMHKMLQKSVNLVPWSLRQYVTRAPVVAPVQRWLVNRYLNGKKFVHEVDAGPAKGLRFELSLPADKAIWTGTYERSLAQHIADAVQPGAVCYDVGGWHGFFAGVMAAAGAKEVFVFEPLPRNILSLERLAALNPNHKITVCPTALGIKTGVTRLCVLPQTSMAKLADSPFQSTTHAETMLTVGVDTVDRLVSSGELPPPGLIKIDVEGAEMLVLQGARQTLIRFRPQVYAEIHTASLLHEAVNYFHNIGYNSTVLEDARVPGRETDASVIVASPQPEDASV